MFLYYTWITLKNFGIAGYEAGILLRKNTKGSCELKIHEFLLYFPQPCSLLSKLRTTMHIIEINIMVGIKMPTSVIEGLTATKLPSLYKWLENQTKHMKQLFSDMGNGQHRVSFPKEGNKQGECYDCSILLPGGKCQALV